MKSEKFKALLLEKEGRGGAVFCERDLSDLPGGDVRVRVKYSSVNYKDALAVTGMGKIARRFPMVPGIDLAGVVEESQSGLFKKGDEVFMTGCGIGEEHWGGYAEMARVKSEWLLPIPKGWTLQQVMGLGTAGFTAMLSVMALEEHGVKPRGKPVVVTGATGGVGSFSVILLSKLGYSVKASTGKLEETGYLKRLGATEVMDRKILAADSGRGLGAERWGGGIDSVGGQTLASLFSGVVRDGCVAVCGLAGGAELKTTVYPMILRGVSLVGISSAWCAMAKRKMAWERLTQMISPEFLDLMTEMIPLDEVPEISQRMMEGKIRGRVVVGVS